MFLVEYFYFFSFSSDFANQMVTEAQVVQSDFTVNETYTGKRYDISNTDASPAGLIWAIPESVFYGIYKPFIYESFSPTLIMNGLESLLLMFLTIRFFIIGNPIKKITHIRKNEILVFALFFHCLSHLWQVLPLFYLGFWFGFVLLCCPFSFWF